MVRGGRHALVLRPVRQGIPGMSGIARRPLHGDVGPLYAFRQAEDGLETMRRVGWVEPLRTADEEGGVAGRPQIRRALLLCERLQPHIGSPALRHTLAVSTL